MVFRIVGIVLVVVTTASSLAAGDATTPNSAPGSYRITSPDGVVKIPFELFRDDIRMVGEINGQEVRMLIDNGSLWDQLLFFGSPRVDSLGLARAGNIEVRGSGSGGGAVSDMSSGITLRFPGIEFRDQVAIITPYEPGRPNLWEGAEGQVSATFFKHFVVEIDFDAMVITLVEPARFQYRGGGVELPLKPLPQGAWAVPAGIELAGGRRLNVDMGLDLGLGDALNVSTGGDHAFVVPERALPASLGFGMSGEIIGHMGRVPGVEIGGYQLDDVLAAFVPLEQSGFPDTDVFLGMGIFSQFNLVFDYPGRRMFVTPNRRFGIRAEYDMSGLTLRRSGDDGLRVTRVLPDTPAAEAGLQAGDLIHHIDGRPAAEIEFPELQSMLRQRGTTLHLEYLREGKREDVSITLRPLI